jgi:hypothetical protein
MTMQFYRRGEVTPDTLPVRWRSSDLQRIVLQLDSLTRNPDSNNVYIIAHSFAAVYGTCILRSGDSIEDVSGKP